MEDRELIQGCLKNSRKHQELLYRRYFATLLAQCKRYELGEDDYLSIINEAFLSIFLHLKSYENKGSFEGWIRRITFHKIADHFRKNKKDIRFLDIDANQHPISELNPDIELTYEELIGKVNTLDKVCKEVFTMYALDGYSHKEIAVQLGFTEGTSKWYLSMARKKLQYLILKSDEYVNNG